MSNKLLLTITLLACAAGVIVAQARTENDPARLVGAWRVDLRSKPGDAPYYQKFEVKQITSDTFAGTFYNSEIRDARFNRDWDALYFAFTTRDAGGGAYHTTGKLVGDRIEGTTHAVDRKFLAVWRAEREK